MKKIIDEVLVRTAIELALPTIRVLVAANTWGPTGVVIAVKWLSISEPVVYVMDELGSEETWERRWGEGKNFRKIALQKLSTAIHGGGPSRNIVANHPWVLEEGDSFYNGSPVYVLDRKDLIRTFYEIEVPADAVAEDGYLAVAASGAYGDTDETVSWIVWNIILLLCQRKIADLQANKINCL